MQNLKNRDLDQLVVSIYLAERLSSQTTVVINTLNHNLEYVLNASRFNYSNGALEGANRMITQIERTALGFHSFDRLVYRIYYRQMV